MLGDRSIRFDGSVIGGARFSPHSPDVWSVLRRNYTGAMLLFHLLLVVAFFTPYLAKTVWWIGVNRLQQVVESKALDLEMAADVIEQQDFPGADRLAESLSRLAAQKPCLSEDCEQRAVWELLLGVEQSARFGLVPYWMLAAMLILYNSGRGFLTWRIAPFRDEEERSGHSPEWGGFAGYGWLIWVHRFVTVVVLLAVVSFAINAYIWLRLPVWVATGS